MDTLEEYFEGVWAGCEAPEGQDEAAARAGARAMFMAGAAALMHRIEEMWRSGADPLPIWRRLDAEVERAMREEWPGYAEHVRDWRARQ